MALGPSNRRREQAGLKNARRESSRGRGWRIVRHPSSPRGASSSPGGRVVGRAEKRTWVDSRRETLNVMPHVVIEEAPDLVAACDALKPSVTRDGSEILKVVDVYLNQTGRTALVDCVTVEAGRSQTFFVQLAQKERQITVRLLPATDPEKTIGVKRVMVLIATQLHEATAGSFFGKTNLQDFLP